jgi:hypothetical protein
MQRVLEFTQNLYRVLSLGSGDKPLLPMGACLGWKSIVGPWRANFQALDPSEFVPNLFGTLFWNCSAV